ncbi:MAG: MMPL family transporter [Candidatus Thiodiazotropha sp.]
MPARVRLLLIWLGALLLGSGWAISHISVRTDLSLFLPKGTAAEQRLFLDEMNQGPASRLLLLAISGGSPESRVQLSQKLAAALRDSDAFEQVENGAPRPFEPDPTLFEYRYLLQADLEQHAFSVEALRSALQQRLMELRSPFPNPFQSQMTADPTGAFSTWLRGNLPQNTLNKARGVWMTRDETRALLVVMTHAGSLELDRQAAALQQIHTRFEQLDNTGVHSLVVSGPGVFATSSRSVIHQESQTLSLIASLAIALMLWLGYRYLPYLLYAALPLATALLSGSVVCRLIFGELHGITLAFGITLLGVTIDYPIHLFSHLRNPARAKADMQAIWPTLRLGVITTCVGYLVLVTTDFTGLQQLGVFTLSGLLTAATVSRTLLPRLFPEPFDSPEPKGLALLRGLQVKRRWPVAITLGAGLVSLLLIASRGTDLWQDDIASLSPLPQNLLQQDRLLRAELGQAEPNHFLVLNGPDVETLLQTGERLREQLQDIPEASLAKFDLPSDHLPSQARQRALQAQLPDPETLARHLQQAMQDLPFHATAFTPFLEAVEHSRTLPPLSYDQAMQTGLKTRLESSIRIGPDGIRALIPLKNVKDPQRLADFVASSLPEIHYLNLRQETSRLVGEFRSKFLARVALGGLFMLLLLWYGLRSLRQAILTLLPIVVAILVTVAILFGSGDSLNLFHLISLMLVLGIGLDYSLFFNRPDQVSEQLRTLHALTICAISTSGVFAILASSSIPVLRAIGLTVAIGVALSYFSTYALSRGWMGTADR